MRSCAANRGRIHRLRCFIMSRHCIRQPSQSLAHSRPTDRPTKRASERPVATRRGAAKRHARHTVGAPPESVLNPPGLNMNREAASPMPQKLLRPTLCQDFIESLSSVDVSAVGVSMSRKQIREVCRSADNHSINRLPSFSYKCTHSSTKGLLIRDSRFANAFAATESKLGGICKSSPETMVEEMREISLFSRTRIRSISRESLRGSV